MEMRSPHKDALKIVMACIMCDLNKPRFEIVIDDDVVPVHLKAMFIIDHHILDRLERIDNYPLNIGVRC